jgi:very-short-patch-repair endonuclease
MKKRKRIRRQERLDSLKSTPRPNNPKDKVEYAKWMEANPTPSEALFLESWRKCRGGNIKPQTVILGFIADFYVKSKKLIIGIDGLIHDDQKDYDAKRDEIFRRSGYNVLRIASANVIADPIGTAMFAIQYWRDCVKLEREYNLPRIDIARLKK